MGGFEGKWGVNDPEFLGIVRAAQNGERRAVETVLIAVRPIAANTVRRFAPGLLSSDDAIQEAMIAVFRALPSFDLQRGKFEPWVRVVIAYSVLNEVRKAYRRKSRDFVDLDELEQTVARIDPGFEIVHLTSALKKLPKEKAELILLRHWVGLTYREMAALSGVALQTVASRYSSAIKALEDLLGGRE